MRGKVRRILVVDGEFVTKAVRCRDNGALFPNRSRVAVKIKLSYLQSWRITLPFHSTSGAEVSKHMRDILDMKNNPSRDQSRLSQYALRFCPFLPVSSLHHPSRIGSPGKLPIAYNQSMRANSMTFIRSLICSICLTNSHALDFLESSDSL